jgi:arsenite/tail-anchored protein-transporting ATPase
MRLVDTPTRYLFFTGKGGVGKTSVASAAAVALADRGKRVLLVSTDPASNLDDVLGTRLASEPTPVGGVPGLSALNIDPEQAARGYRERVVGPYRGVADDTEVARIEEQLSGACTVEIAAFDEFAGLLADQAPGFDHVVFDTAPTGHTLRLLELPSAWTSFFESNSDGASCLGPHSGLTTQRARYQAAVAALADPDRTTLVLVARPDGGALREAARSSAELAELGLRNQTLVVNGVFRATRRDDPVAMALEARGLRALAALPDGLRSLPREEVPLYGHNIVGVEALRAFLDGSPVPDALAASGERVPDLPPLSALVDEIAASGHGLVLVTGKGGVGKTTIAAAIAVELAARGLPVHLTTTDPAAHVAAALEEDVPGLRVSRIDPKAETEGYIRKALEAAAPGKDAEGLAALEEDLRSPCTEEVAVFHAFSKLIAGARREIVVMDTAPTGHTLLLLDATGAYHREMLKKFGGRALGTPMTRLRDPEHTKVLIVTLAETTPVLEAAELQADLRRAGIEPYAWVINASLAAAGTSDPVLARRAAAELGEIERVRAVHAGRIAIVAWQSEEPIGRERVRRLAAGAPVPDEQLVR